MLGCSAHDCNRLIVKYVITLRVCCVTHYPVVTCFLSLATLCLLSQIAFDSMCAAEDRSLTTNHSN